MALPSPGEGRRSGAGSQRRPVKRRERRDSLDIHPSINGRGNHEHLSTTRTVWVEKNLSCICDVLFTIVKDIFKSEWQVGGVKISQ